MLVKKYKNYSTVMGHWLVVQSNVNLTQDRCQSWIQFYSWLWGLQLKLYWFSNRLQITQTTNNTMQRPPPNLWIESPIPQPLDYSQISIIQSFHLFKLFSVPSLISDGCNIFEQKTCKFLVASGFLYSMFPSNINDWEHYQKK